MSEDASLVAELRSRAQAICSAKGWSVVKALGAGASAAVFEVSTPDGVRALKLYAPRFLEGALGETTRQRFDIVIQHLLNHDCPTLVRCYEGKEVDGALYMLMERVPGSCLTDVLATVPRSKIRSIVAQIALAAKYLEDRKLCHRDIKCDNIVVSDDFESARLLDLGVIRWIDSEDGAGTDNSGQLPFVATARYSSPEYMFRLIDASHDLWRALTFYQLGAVLYGLINRQQIFEEVVKKSSQNRYLIAHAVATKNPEIEPDSSVDPDLIVLAQRALQKDFSSRIASVGWDDFLDTSRAKRRELLLGLRTASIPTPAHQASVDSHQLSALEAALDQRLMGQHLDCRHASEILDLGRGVVRIWWLPSSAREIMGGELQVDIGVEADGDTLAIKPVAYITLDGEMLIFNGPVSSLSPSSAAFATDLIEHAFEGFLEASALAVEAALRQQPASSGGI